MLMSAVTVILWQVKLGTTGLQHFVYIYLLPVVLIAALYNGRLAILCAAIADNLCRFILAGPTLQPGE